MLCLMGHIGHSIPPSVRGGIKSHEMTTYALSRENKKEQIGNPVNTAPESIETRKERELSF